MAYVKKKKAEKVKIVVAEIVEPSKIECPHCKSKTLKLVKETVKGGLYSCGCGNRCQL